MATGLRTARTFVTKIDAIVTSTWFEFFEEVPRYMAMNALDICHTPPTDVEVGSIHGSRLAARRIPRTSRRISLAGGAVVERTRVFRSSSQTHRAQILQINTPI